MIDIKARFDTSILNYPKENLGDDDSLQIWIHDNDNVCAFYAHFCLLECFEDLDGEIDIPPIIAQCHSEGHAVVGRYKNPQEILEKIEALNNKTDNDLRFTIQ